MTQTYNINTEKKLSVSIESFRETSRYEELRSYLSNSSLPKIYNNKYLNFSIILNTVFQLTLKKLPSSKDTACLNYSISELTTSFLPQLGFEK